MFSGISSYNTCLNVVYRRRHGPTIVLSLFYRYVDDTLFEVSREICFMCVKSLLLLWKPHSWF